jgi:hypothetical protein
MDSQFDSEKYKKVKKRIHEIKQFYKHFSAYLIINLFFIGRRIYKDIDRGDSVIEAFTDLSNYNFFFWWGVFLIFHAAKVFGFPNLFNKNWEERKIKEFMKENK